MPREHNARLRLTQCSLVGKSNCTTDAPTAPRDVPRGRLPSTRRRSRPGSPPTVVKEFDAHIRRLIAKDNAVLRAASAAGRPLVDSSRSPWRSESRLLAQQFPIDARGVATCS